MNKKYRNPTSQIEIVCHRGANEYAPENTYASAQLCIDWGMDYVEIDVMTSKDGVLYVFHGPELEKTTNGSGYIFATLASELDKLDAGSWFSPEFAGERIPRLDEFLRWIKGKAKLFFDVKFADLDQIIHLVRENRLEEESFFWFEYDWMARCFRLLAPDLTLKMNAATVEQIVEADEVYWADIIEIGLDNVNQELVDACRERAMRLMLIQGPERSGGQGPERSGGQGPERSGGQGKKDPEAFRQMLAWQPDLVNVDHADLFARIAAGGVE